MSVNPIHVADFHAVLSVEDESALCIDTRSADRFVAGFVPGSISMPLFEILPDQVEGIFERTQPVYIVCNPAQAEESISYLKKLGFANVTGWLQGGFEAWTQGGFKFDLIIDILPDELALDIRFDETLVIIDVRTLAEYADGHVEDAAHMPLADFADVAEVAMLPDHVNTYIYCSNGIRSTTAASFFKRHGYQNIRVVLDTWEVIAATEGIVTQKDAALLN